MRWAPISPPFQQFLTPMPLLPCPTQAWMNERMMRWAPKSAAEFITAFSDGNAQFGDSTWLVWTYEGDYTLADLMVVSC